MGRKRKQRRKQPVEYQPPVQGAAPVKSGWPKWIVPFALGAMVAAFIVFVAMQEHSSQANSSRTDLRSVANSGSHLPSLGDLALMPTDELAKQDLALLNLRCAEGLPGAEDLNVAKCLSTLDRWTQKVRFDTDRHLYKYRQNPAEFENSEAYYRMMMLVTVLQQDFKVHYNKERIRDIDFTKSKDLFLHGMVGSNGPESNGGTCVSMPVIYTAVARRLGYPVYLVTANAHVFCRWDSPKERFNIEATNQGMNSFEDDYYMTWPKPISQADVDRGWYLKSLDTSESFAMFLAARGHCLEDNRFGAKARVAYAMAHEKSPSHPLYFGFLAQTLRPPGRQVASYRPKRRPYEPPQVYPQDPFSQQQNAAAQAATFQLPQEVFKPVVTPAADPFSQQQTGVSGPAGFGIQP